MKMIVRFSCSLRTSMHHFTLKMNRLKRWLVCWRKCLRFTFTIWWKFLWRKNDNLWIMDPVYVILVRFYIDIIWIVLSLFACCFAFSIWMILNWLARLLMKDVTYWLERITRHQWNSFSTNRIWQSSRNLVACAWIIHGLKLKPLIWYAICHVTFRISLC